jgi:uncharacterized membrane protein
MSTSQASTAASAEERSSSALTVALLAIVLVVAAIFAFSSSALVPNHWYAVFKFIHVAFAVIWIGGGALLTILALVAERKTDPMEVVLVARQAALVGEKLFAPAGLVVFLMGVAMMLNTNWGWGKFWIVAGLIGYAVTFVTGVAVLAPLAKKIKVSAEENGPTDPVTMALISRILLIARVDVSVLFLVVADMVMKPFS